MSSFFWKAGIHLKWSLDKCNVEIIVKIELSYKNFNSSKYLTFRSDNYNLLYAQWGDTKTSYKSVRIFNGSRPQSPVRG